MQPWDRLLPHPIKFFNGQLGEDSLGILGQDDGQAPRFFHIRSDFSQKLIIGYSSRRCQMQFIPNIILDELGNLDGGSDAQLVLRHIQIGLIDGHGLY